MPFKSKQQRKWMYANKPKMAAEWEAETYGDLPERATKKKKKKPSPYGKLPYPSHRK